MQNEPMVHIVDDDDAVREALQLLMQSDDIPVQTYESAEDFLEQQGQSRPGCLLLDMRMPGLNGLELLNLLKEQDSPLPVVFITGHGDVGMAVEAMKAGAVDFIEKPFDNERLLTVMRNCLVDCVAIKDSYERRQEMQDRIARLTKREREVMDLLVEGKQNKVIAIELDISPRTVELHRAKVMEKLQAHTLSEVVRTAILATGSI